MSDPDNAAPSGAPRPPYLNGASAPHSTSSEAAEHARGTAATDLARSLATMDPLPGVSAIGPLQTERKARDYALVLQSMSIYHTLRRGMAGWFVLVRDEDYPKAVGAIDRYEVENRDWPPRPTRERARHPASIFVPLVFVALVAFFAVTGPVRAGSFWFDRGLAVSAMVLSTEPFRAITALTLHADGVHVLGNAISGTVFVSSLERRLGTGGALLAVLASGGLGNFANAAYYRFIGQTHVSLGASTAVFGAIGLLAATQFVIDRPARPLRGWPTYLRAVAPIFGGLALLGALGAGGERTDLGAHLCGFVSGLVLGIPVALPLRRSRIVVNLASSSQAEEVSLDAGTKRWWLQTVLGSIAAAVVVVSWELAVQHR